MIILLHFRIYKIKYIPNYDTHDISGITEGDRVYNPIPWHFLCMC